MRKALPAWVALADARRARLLRCDVTPLERLHIEQVDETEFQWAGHEHGRPTPLAAKTGNTYAAPKHEVEEEMRRFARQVAQWLEQKADELAIEQVTVFAPARFVGELRRAYSSDLAKRVRERETELMNLPRGELHEHPALREVVGI